MSELLDAVDALVARPDILPPPEVRARLRKADGLTQQEVAKVFGVTRAAFNRWEVGAVKPHRHRLEAYAHLLRRWATKHPEAAEGFFAETD
ncbi:helix-turn-helix domain-containing protein [Streptomyces sp. SS1-1]|uniref:helix-turn-helix domain-containing protein n=1 Tax=Streptomyces sp. SS1-1 TaxID=2651869 RepID=UPI00124FA969|nr:helix-turn-helix domain-containing protein [Streptomyces sp. SS1-1]KAB2977454.1 helix-turn-helix domain-containing protein [Streptomyces sp. SS1-1]